MSNQKSENLRDLNQQQIIGLVVAALVVLCVGVGIGYLLPHKTKVATDDTSSQSTGSILPVTTVSTPQSDNTATAPTFSPITLTGTGQQATKTVTLPTGGYRVTMTHDGQDNFIVHLVDSGGNTIGSSLANEIGPQNISQVINVAGGDYLFNVEADGNWTIKIDSI